MHIVHCSTCDEFGYYYNVFLPTNAPSRTSTERQIRITMAFSNSVLRKMFWMKMLWVFPVLRIHMQTVYRDKKRCTTRYRPSIWNINIQGVNFLALILPIEYRVAKKEWESYCNWESIHRRGLWQTWKRDKRKTWKTFSSFWNNH